jgi:PAS domain S-box-containing protein
MGGIMDASPAAVTVINSEGQFTYANAEAERVLGLPRNQIIQRRHNAPEWRLTDDEGRPVPDGQLPFERVMRLRGPVRNARLIIQGPDGQSKRLCVHASPLLDESGRVSQVVAVWEEAVDAVPTAPPPGAGYESFLRSFEFINDAVFLQPVEPEKHGRVFAAVNDAACQWLGYSREEFTRLSPMEVNPDETAGEFEARANQLLTQGSLIFETSLRAKDGRRIPVEVNARIFEWDGQKMAASVARDLTKRRVAEAALRESERRFREIMGNMRLLAVMLDREGRVLFANAFLLRLTGWTLEEITHRDWFALFVPPDQSAQVKEKYLARVERTPAPYYEYHIMTRPGERRLVAWSSTALLDVAGEVIGVAGIGEDVTDRKKAEEALRKSEENFRNIVGNAPVGIFQSTADRLATVNPTLVRMFGYESPEDMLVNVPVSAALFVQPEQRAEIVRRAMESGSFAAREVEYRRKDGSTFTANLRMRAACDEKGGLKFLEGFVEDITEAKRREAELVKMSRAIEQSPVTIIITDPAGRIEYVNPKFTQMTGYTSEEALGQNTRMLKSGKTTAAEYERMWEAIKTGREWRGEFMTKAKDGRLFWEFAVISPIVGKAGQITHFLAVKEDITERKRLEERLREAQKMEAIGQLAGGVAHDFNNILAATLMHLGLLQQSSQLSPAAKESLQEVERETLRAANLTRQLLLFGRRHVAKVEPLDLNELINELMKMLRRLLGEQIDIRFQSFHEAVWVSADSGMMEQVVMNLCINARDAMPGGGQLTLATARVELPAPSVDTHPDARPGRFVCLSVADTGCGMEESVLKRIFEPFFTTKEVGKGTGLGLASVYGIVKQHGGWVEVESVVSRGSVFRVYLPAGTGPAAPAASVGGAEEIKGGSETILLVEDEPYVRRMSALCLRKLGYAVLEAGDGLEALKVWSQHQREIALLFTDMVMPHSMSGLDLAIRLRKDKGVLKVIVSSGYSADLAGPRPKKGEEVVYLPKPYQAAALARLVRRCLDGQ